MDGGGIAFGVESVERETRMDEDWRMTERPVEAPRHK